MIHLRECVVNTGHHGGSAGTGPKKGSRSDGEVARASRTATHVRTSGSCRRLFKEQAHKISCGRLGPSTLRQLQGRTALQGVA